MEQLLGHLSACASCCNACHLLQGPPCARTASTHHPLGISLHWSCQQSYPPPSLHGTLCSMGCCARLVSEQEVQALSIDAATANVEVHYAYICDAYGAFMGRYQQQAAAHAGAAPGWSK